MPVVHARHVERGVGGEAGLLTAVSKSRVCAIRELVRCLWRGYFDGRAGSGRKRVNKRR